MGRIGIVSVFFGFVLHDDLSPECYENVILDVYNNTHNIKVTALTSGEYRSPQGYAVSIGDIQQLSVNVHGIYSVHSDPLTFPFTTEEQKYYKDILVEFCTKFNLPVEMDKIGWLITRHIWHTDY
jgi:hypothetical protein